MEAPRTIREKLGAIERIVWKNIRRLEPLEQNPESPAPEILRQLLRLASLAALAERDLAEAVQDWADGVAFREAVLRILDDEKPGLADRVRARMAEYRKLG